MNCVGSRVAHSKEKYNSSDASRTVLEIMRFAALSLFDDFLPFPRQQSSQFPKNGPISHRVFDDALLTRPPRLRD